MVSAPSLELFAAQPDVYQEEVLPSSVKSRVVVEAATQFGWHRWAGSKGQVRDLGKIRRQRSRGRCHENLGFTPENVVAAAKESIFVQAQ